MTKLVIFLYFVLMIRYYSALKKYSTQDCCNNHIIRSIGNEINAIDKLDCTQLKKNFRSQRESTNRNIMRFFSTILGFGFISCSSLLPVIADSSWTDRNRLAAETWRAVDEGYLDRTFGGQEWFKLRQEVVKKNYKSDEELYQSLATMVSKLGDKYTRKAFIIVEFHIFAYPMIMSCSMKAFWIPLNILRCWAVRPVN